MEPRYIVGTVSWSRRITCPASSNCLNIVSGSPPPAIISAAREIARMVAPIRSRGCAEVRSLNQASRGRIHRIRSGRCLGPGATGRHRPGLAAPDDGVAGAVVGAVGEFVERDARRPGRDRERRHVGGWYVALQVAGVDQAASYLDPMLDARGQVAHHVVPTGAADVLVTPEEPHLPGGLQHLPHHPAEVVLHLRAGGLFVEAVVVPAHPFAIRAQRQRPDPVVARGRVQPHERVGVAPVAARLVSPVDQEHLVLDSAISVSAKASPLAPAPTTR